MCRFALMGAFLIAWTVCAGNLTLAIAEDPAAKQTLPSPSSADDVLHTAAWRSMLHDYDEWASVQKMYTPAEIAKFRAKLIEKATTLQGDELQDFLEDIRARLDILASAEARQARAWLSQNLAVASDAYAEKIKARYPDVARLTASQLQEQLDEFEDRLGQRRATNAELKRLREQRVADIQAERIRQENAVAQANARAASSGNSYSGYGGNIRTYPSPANRGWRGGWGGWGGYRW